MRIGIDIRNIGKKRTGDEVVFFNLVNSLAKIDSQNSYFLFTDVANPSILRNMVVIPLEIEGKDNFQIISLKSPNKFIWNIWALPKYLRKNKIDIYHTQYITPFFVPKKTKIITTIHDISFNFFSQLIKKTDLFFLKLLMPHSLKRADKILAVSQFTRDEIIKYYKTDPNKIEVTYNAVDDKFMASEYSAEELDKVRKKYNLPEKFILYIGTMQPRKNVAFLIEGFAKIRDRLSNTKLVVAGKKGAHNYDNAIDKAIGENNLESEIIFPGFIEEGEKPAVFKLARTFVFPSLYEGFGIPVLEAMSQKIPVVTSNIPSLKEIAGKGAEYFEIGSLENLEEKLYNVSVKEDIRRNLINSGLERVRFFSWKKTAGKVLKIYKQVIDNK